MIDSRDDEGRTLLSLAVKNDLTPLVELALGFGADPDLWDANPFFTLGWTPLKHAVVVESSTSVRTLLDHGADPNLEDRNGWTPLLYAIFLRRPRPMIQMLLDSNANPNHSTSLTENPLSVALKQRRNDLVCLLLDYGADPDIVEWYKKSPLDIAKGTGQWEMVQLLLKHRSGQDGSGMEKYW